MILRICVPVLLLLALSGCQQKNARFISSTYADGVNHTEPVFYNGKRYLVSFRYQSSSDAYNTVVAGKGRKLGGQPGDQKVVEEVAKSAIRHFACARGQQGQIVPGSSRHTGGKWAMVARCLS